MSVGVILYIIFIFFSQVSLFSSLFDNKMYIAFMTRRWALTSALFNRDKKLQVDFVGTGWKRKKSQLDGEINVFWSRTSQEGNDINFSLNQLKWQTITQNESILRLGWGLNPLWVCLVNHQARNDLRRPRDSAPSPYLWKVALQLFRTDEQWSYFKLSRN